MCKNSRGYSLLYFMRRRGVYSSQYKKIEIAISSLKPSIGEGSDPDKVVNELKAGTISLVELLEIADTWQLENMERVLVPVLTLFRHFREDIKVLVNGEKINVCKFLIAYEFSGGRGTHSDFYELFLALVKQDKTDLVGYLMRIMPANFDWVQFVVDANSLERFGLVIFEDMFIFILENIQTQEEEVSRLLDVSLRYHKLKVAEYLINSKGADVNEGVNCKGLLHNGKTYVQSLLVARDKSNIDDIKYLVEKCGVNITREDIEAAKDSTFYSANKEALNYLYNKFQERNRKAAVTLLCIRWHRPDSVFSPIPKDVVRLIAKHVIDDPHKEDIPTLTSM